MKKNDAIKTLSALAHDGRLTLMRRLIEAGPDGVVAGELARHAGIESTTASGQLLVLVNSGLIRSERNGRFITYFSNYDHLRELLQFLMRDCCGNRQEICCGLMDGTEG